MSLVLDDDIPPLSIESDIPLPNETLPHSDVPLSPSNSLPFNYAYSPPYTPVNDRPVGRSVPLPDDILPSNDESISPGNSLPPSPALSAITTSSVHFDLPPSRSPRGSNTNWRSTPRFASGNGRRGSIPTQYSLSSATLDSFGRTYFSSAQGSSYTPVTSPYVSPTQSSINVNTPKHTTRGVHQRSHSLSVSFNRRKWSLSLTSIPQTTIEDTSTTHPENRWDKLRRKFKTIRRRRRHSTSSQPSNSTTKQYSATSLQDTCGSLPLTANIAEFQNNLTKVTQHLNPQGSSRLIRAFTGRNKLSYLEDLIWILSESFHNEDFKKKIIDLPTRDLQNFVDATQDLVLKNPKGILGKQHDKFCIRLLRLQVRIARERNIFPSSLYIKGLKLVSRDPVTGGGFADVFCATYKAQTVALKRIRVFKSNAGFKALSTQIYRECLIWRQLEHEHVLPFLGVDRDTFSGMVCLVSPWMKNGTITEYLDSHNIKDPVHLKRMIYGVSNGLAYLHSKNIVHADLRGANILVSDNGEPRLTDFGLTVFADSSMNRSGTTNTLAGAVKWTSPEVLSPTTFGLEVSQKTFASDVYAFACVIIEIYTLKPPFWDLIDGAALFPILEGRRPRRPPNMEDEVWELMGDCWKHDFLDRPSMLEVLGWTEPWR